MNCAASQEFGDEPAPSGRFPRSPSPPNVVSGATTLLSAVGEPSTYEEIGVNSSICWSPWIEVAQCVAIFLFCSIFMYVWTYILA